MIRSQIRSNISGSFACPAETYGADATIDVIREGLLQENQKTAMNLTGVIVKNHKLGPDVISMD
jgi:hypothetical protein